MQKTIDISLFLVSLAAGVIMTLLPKTLPSVITSLLLIFGLLVYPIWNFWYIERSLWLRLAALFFLAFCLCVYGYIVLPKEKDVFKCNFITTMRFEYPGYFFMVYPSKLGNTISFPNIAIYVEAVNNKPTFTRIFSYQCRAFLKYDEGGSRVVTLKPSGGWDKYVYKPSGRSVEKWQKLHSMGFLGSNIYYMWQGLEKCRRLDFTQNGFDNLARDKQLEPGGSIKGWIFLEFETDELRLQLPEIKEIELTIWNSIGESQVCRSGDGIKISDDANSVISSGGLTFEPGVYDLTKEKYTATPMVDLKANKKMDTMP